MSKLKKSIYQKSKANTFYAFDIMEFEKNRILMAVVERNLVTFMSNSGSFDSQLRVKKQFKIEFDDHPETREISYACALGIYWNSYNQSSIVFAFGGYIGFIYLMNLDTNSEIQTEILKGCYGNIMCLKFLKSVKNRMLSSAKDCSLCLWDITKREIMYKFVDQSCLLSVPNCFVI